MQKRFRKPLTHYEIRKKGISYTVDTVRHFRRREGEGVRISWLIGADSLPGLPSWREHHGLLRLCRLLIMPRSGYPPGLLEELRKDLSPEEIARLREGFLPVPPVDVSSTEIRNRLRSGGSLEGLVPPPVISWLEGRRIYGGPEP